MIKHCLKVNFWNRESLHNNILVVITSKNMRIKLRNADLDVIIGSYNRLTTSPISAHGGYICTLLIWGHLAGRRSCKNFVKNFAWIDPSFSDLFSFAHRGQNCDGLPFSKKAFQGGGSRWEGPISKSTRLRFLAKYRPGPFIHSIAKDQQCFRAPSY